MSFESPTLESEKNLEAVATVEVEPGYEGFIPEEFRENPLGYFESRGRNIKPGQTRRDEFGAIREDPTAVKELPTWVGPDGRELQTVGKRVNVEKGMIGKSRDPFYEYGIMEVVSGLGLPTPKPVAKAEQQGAHLIVMEKVEGTNWYGGSILKRERGYSDEDIENLKRQAEVLIGKLKQEFEDAGITRSWKLSDMIFSIRDDVVVSVTPTDWERTKINYEKLEAYKREHQL